MSNINKIENHIAETSQQAVVNINEQIDSPSIEQGSNQAEAESTKEYSRQHADGQVHNGTVDKALEICTAMKGMPREKAIGAITMAEMGKEMRAAAKARAELTKKSDSKVNSLNTKKDTLIVKTDQKADKIDAIVNPIPDVSILESQPELVVSQEIVPKILTAPHKEVFEQNVRLIEISTAATLSMDKLDRETTLDSFVTDIKNETQEITAEPIRLVEETSESSPEITSTDEIHEAPIYEQSDQLLESVLKEMEPIEIIEPMTDEFTYVPVSESEIETTALTFEQEFMTVEAIPDEPIETEFSVAPQQSEVQEEVEKAPAVAVAEFMLQVMPAVTQEVYERVQEMEPEAAAEVAAQIETISIVADRLHVLVLEGNTEGEEAKQIEAYLKREYEQLLVAVGIEPTEEILDDFIRYIYSAEYQIREEINLKELEIIDEGTHEKKLFDEQGVFSRAQAASSNLSRRLDRSIGRLVVNFFST